MTYIHPDLQATAIIWATILLLATIHKLTTKPRNRRTNNKPIQ